MSFFHAIIISNKGWSLKIKAITLNLSLDSFNKKLIGVLSSLRLIGLILLFMKEDSYGKICSGLRNLYSVLML